VDFSTPEVEILALPSSFTLAMHASLGLDALTAIEYDLQEALHTVREGIKTFNYNLAFKKVNIHGQSANTCAQTFLKGLATEQVSAADKYRRARDTLLKLGLSETDDVLRPLVDNDLWMNVCAIFGHVGTTFHTSTLHNHKLNSLWYGKPISLKYLIATHMPVQIVR
jgi:hypothetical protein